MRTSTTIIAAAAIALGGCGGIVDSRHGGLGNEGEANNNGGQSGNGGRAGPAAPAKKCGKTSAPSLMRNALCLCGDLKDVGALLVRRGTQGQVATFSVNGAVNTINHSGVDGDLVAHRGLSAVANFDVGGALRSNGAVKFTGRLAVKKDMTINGDLSGIGFLSVGGKLSIGGQDRVLGVKRVAAMGRSRASGQAPCDCAPGRVLDVRAEVARARASNDNAKVGLPANPLRHIGASKLTLNTGRYYFGTKASIGYTRVKVNGAVKIYIGGDLDAIGYDRYEITNGSTLDLYVAGSVRTVGHMVFGERHHPSAFRLYVGGDQRLSMSVGNQVFRGSIYAPRATLASVGRTKIEGSLFAKTLANVGLMELYYTQPIHGPDGKKCQPPNTTKPPTNDKNLPDPKDLPRVM